MTQRENLVETCMTEIDLVMTLSHDLRSYVQLIGTYNEHIRVRMLYFLNAKQIEQLHKMLEEKYKPGYMRFTVYNTTWWEKWFRRIKGVEVRLYTHLEVTRDGYYGKGLPLPLAEN